MGNTSIEWCDKVWNCIRGCTRVSPGCVNCYAEATAARFSGAGSSYAEVMERSTSTPPGAFHGYAIMTDSGPRWTGKVELIEDMLDIPLHWRTPRRVFVNSMSDLFHEALPDEAIDKVFAIMALCPQHTFQVLTKRPERMLNYCAAVETRYRLGIATFDLASRLPVPKNGRVLPHEHRPDSTEEDPKLWSVWPLPNAWLGVSVEDQATADSRIPLLLQTPAALRFVSYEPALGPVDFTRLDYRDQIRRELVKFARWDAKQNGTDEERAASQAAASIPAGDLSQGEGNPALNALTGESFDGWDSGAGEKKLDWVIVGGESGSGARPFRIDWARSAIEQCRAAGCACFVKQLGAWPCEIEEDGRCTKVYDFRDRKGGDPAEWPDGLLVREFPKP